MSYYILPKNNKEYKFNIIPTHNNQFNIIISHTLFESILKIYYQLNYYDKHELNNIIQNINPYEFVFTHVYEPSVSISKIVTSSNIYYELFEIIHTFFINDQSVISNPNCLYFGENYDACKLLVNSTFTMFEDCFKGFPFNNTTINDYYLNSQKESSFEYMIFECNAIIPILSNNYDNEILKNEINHLYISFLTICKLLCHGGSVIIKITSLIHKSIIDILMLLCNMFEKVIIFKPLLTNILSNEKYIICLQYNENNKQQYISFIEPIVKIMETDSTYSISSLLDNNIPYNYLNKIEEFNAVNGQQQLETYDQVINIIHNKNKNDKLEMLKKANIQKGILWCEKNNIPHNKFIDKLNIFLHFSDDLQKSNQEEIPNIFYSSL